MKAYIIIGSYLYDSGYEIIGVFLDKTNAENKIKNLIHNWDVISIEEHVINVKSEIYTLRQLFLKDI